MRGLALLLAVTAFAGCSIPAVVHVPLPPPSADEAPGVSVSGSVGLGTLTHGSGYGALIVRPVKGLGLYISGVQAMSDSSDTSPAFFSRQRITEGGITGALPTSEKSRVTASLSYRWGRVWSGGQVDEFCLFSGPCPSAEYTIDTNARTVAGSLGLVTHVSDAVQLGFQGQLASTRFDDASYTIRGNDLPTPESFDGWFGGVGPTLLVRSGPASFHFRATSGFDLGGLPTFEYDRRSSPRTYRLFTADPLTVQAGLSVDLVGLWTRANHQPDAPVPVE